MRYEPIRFIPALTLLLAAPAATADTLAVSRLEAFRESEIAARNAAPRAMQRYVIEREIPGAGKLTLDELRGGAARSNGVLREMGSDIQWVHSYVAGDKVYCIYNATSEALIREHAARSGFPAHKVTPVSMVVDPTTASR
jgi:hypothetical protein